MTHGGWFVRSFDRFIDFGDAGDVREVDAPTWEV